MDKVQLLGEIEALIRRMPNAETLIGSSDEALIWCGEGQACMQLWHPQHAATFTGACNGLVSMSQRHQSIRTIRMLLHRAQAELRMATVGPISTPVGQGAVFHYFDEVRKLIETAATDLLVVDPYLDAEFVSTYLGIVKAGVTVRLLTHKCIPSLVPAARLAAQQYGLDITVRSVTGMHDRYVFIDGARAFYSGASFKDGAKHAPTLLNEVVDAFEAVHKTYELKWSQATPHQ